MNDGGPAFPKPWEVKRESGCYQPGMSLRDYFAGQALAGLATGQEMLLANHDLTAEFGTRGIDNLQANKAYRLADAMLAEREKAK